MNSNLKKITDLAIVMLTVVICIGAAWFLFRKSATHGPVPVVVWSGTSIGAGGNGAVLKNVTFTEGVTGQAFFFEPEKVHAYTGVQIPDSPAYALTNSMSIVSWIRPHGNGYIIFFRGDHRPGLDPYGLSMQGNHDLRFWICGASNDETASIGTEIPFGEWVHVAAVLDGRTGNMNLFVNGKLAAQTNTTVRPFGPLLADQSPGIGIGNLNDGGNNFPFSGAIDGVALYDRALTADEVAASYAQYADKAAKISGAK